MLDSSVAVQDALQTLMNSALQPPSVSFSSSIKLSDFSILEEKIITSKVFVIQEETNYFHSCLVIAEWPWIFKDAQAFCFSELSLPHLPI